MRVLHFHGLKIGRRNPFSRVELKFTFLLLPPTDESLSHLFSKARYSEYSSLYDVERRLDAVGYQRGNPSGANAIDKVAALGSVTTDFDGDLRPQGSGADIGADEYTPATPPEKVTEPETA